VAGDWRRQSAELRLRTEEGDEADPSPRAPGECLCGANDDRLLEVLAEVDGQAGKTIAEGLTRDAIQEVRPREIEA